MIRLLQTSELEAVKELHRCYYSNEFAFPDLSQFICVLAAVDDNNKIVTAGGIRPILEAVLITDISQSVKLRRKALLEMLQSISFVAQRSNYNQIHAFVQDEGWLKQLVKQGFSKCRGEALYLNIKD